MFRKILISYFSQAQDSEISPVNFHLKLLSWELFYDISINHSLENRRSIQFDNNFRYFDSFEKKFKNKNDKNFYYSYKSFANLNWHNNYNIYVWMPTILLLVLRKYYKYFRIDNFWIFINPLLYWFQNLMSCFFARFKEYENKSEKENIDYMMELLGEIIFKLELSKNKNQNVKKAQEITDFIMNILKKEPEFLTFIYKTTKEFRWVFEAKNFTDMLLYDYLTSSSINSFQWNKQLQESLIQNYKLIFIERFSKLISQDMIILLSIINGERWYISYLTNKDNLDFIPYFVDSLKHLESIDLNKDFHEIIDEVLNFKKRWNNFINALKEFNLENIDFNLDLSLWIEKVQEMMSKEMMDAVQNISNINEQFLDYFILLISRKINSNGDSAQFLFKQDWWKIWEIYSQNAYNELRQNYIKLDKQYFLQSYRANKKKIPSDLDLNYNYVDKIISFKSLEQAKKKLLLDFQKKEHKEYIKSKKYLQTVKNHFQTDISKLLKSKNIKKDYLQKYFPESFKKIEIEDKLLKNFKENIYYSDFMVYYKFLEFSKIQFKNEHILLASRLRESIFGYIILRKILQDKQEIFNIYENWVNFYHQNLTLNLDKFYYYFWEHYGDFLSFFTNVNQNQEFARITEEMFKSAKYKNFYIFENAKDMSNYNKRIFKL